MLRFKGHDFLIFEGDEMGFWERRRQSVMAYKQNGRIGFVLIALQYLINPMFILHV